MHFVVWFFAFLIALIMCLFFAILCLCINLLVSLFLPVCLCSLFAFASPTRIQTAFLADDALFLVDGSFPPCFDSSDTLFTFCSWLQLFTLTPPFPGILTADFWLIKRARDERSSCYSELETRFLSRSGVLAVLLDFVPQFHLAVTLWGSCESLKH